MNTQSPRLATAVLHKIDAYWRAANYLAVGQIYLYDNPLLRTPLTLAHIKPRLLGHWGTTPGLNFIYVHLNRVIKEHDLSVIYIAGPGHGGPGMVANAYLEQTYTEVYPHISQDEAGMKRLFTQFSFPGGIPSHVAPDLQLPAFRDYAVTVTRPGAADAEATRVQGEFIRDVIKHNPDNFRVFSPDETNSNRWNAVFEVTNRCSTAEILPADDHIAADGRVMEVLSEHQCEGWLEGYLLTGRHGFFSCYEAFIHIIDSMFNQHAKWLKVSNEIPWRRPIASLNYLLTSHVWRQGHNGFSHQDPGFIDVVANKTASVIRVYLPPDANTLLSVTDHCLRSRNYVNVVVAGKQPSPQWLDMAAAIAHCTAGLGIWRWASNDRGGEPDVVMACCGDVPTLETLAAVELLGSHFPDLKVRVINVVNLMKLQPQSEHPHGLSDEEFDALFTTDKPIIFAYHGYPSLIHQLTYRRTNHHNLHVRGFKEEGTTTTPFDMVVLNDLDRFHLVGDVIARVPALGPRAAHVQQAISAKLLEHRQYIAEHGEDMPEIRNWRWRHGTEQGTVLT